jgi:transposase
MEINKRKSTASCSSNQQCHFNYKVIAHPIAETLLCDNSPVKIKELRAMIDLNIRELKGLDISYRYTIKEENGIWLVPSSSGRGEKYKVSLKPESCTCPDFEIRRSKCKHIFAVEYVIKNAPLNDIISKDKAKLISEAPKITFKRKTYKQIWSAYNEAQRTEKAQFQILLAELCRGIGEPSQAKGRPRLPLEDMLFASVFKVYSTFSLRRFNTDLQEAKTKGFIISTPNHASIARTFADEKVTAYLKMMIEESSLPLAEIENAFAVDASGLSTSQGFTWLHAKFTEPRLIDKRDWLKIHICTGVKTNIVTAVEVTEKYEHDSNQFEPLVKATAQNFGMKEVSADKAYLSKANIQTAINNNAIPYIAWKSNSKLSNKQGNHLWNKLFHYYALNQERFLEHYHKRSNVETTFSMIKAKFGANLRSKTRTAQINEALCKVLAHNICVLIQSMYELGIKPDFWQ